MVIYSRRKKAWLAQLVEQRTENPRVSGSIPEPGTKKIAVDYNCDFLF